MLDTIASSCKVRVLRALVSGRVGLRAKNLLLRKEEQLHSIRVDRRTRATGRSFLVHALQYRLQVRGQLLQKCILEPGIHSGTGKATAVCIRVVHLSGILHQVFQAEGDTSFTAARKIIMTEAHDHKGKGLAVDADILLVAHLPKGRGFTCGRGLADLRPSVICKNLVEEQALCGIGLAGVGDLDGDGLGLFTGLRSGDRVSAGGGDLQVQHTVRRDSPRNGFRTSCGYGRARLRGHAQSRREVGQRQAILLYIIDNNVLSCGLTVQRSGHCPGTISRKGKGHRAGARRTQRLRATFTGDRAPARNSNDDLRRHADRAELRLRNLAVGTKRGHTARSTFLACRNIVERRNLRSRNLSVPVESRNAIRCALLRGGNVVQGRQLPRRDFTVRAKGRNAVRLALLVVGDVVERRQLTSRNLAVLAERGDAPSLTLFGCRDIAERRQLLGRQLAAGVEISLFLENLVDLIGVRVKVCDVAEVLRRRLYQVVVFRVRSHLRKYLLFDFSPGEFL